MKCWRKNVIVIELDYMEMEMKGKIIDDKMGFRVGPGVMELAFGMGYRSSGGGSNILLLYL